MGNGILVSATQRNGVTALALLVVYILSASPGYAANQRLDRQIKDLQKFNHKPNEVIVKLKEEGRNENSHILIRDLSKHYDVSARHLQTENSIIELKAGAGTSVEELLTTIGRQDEIEYVEPNWIYTTNEVTRDADAVIPNDPDLSLNWGLLNTGQKDAAGQVGTPGADIATTQAWKITKGSNDVTVAVIDTGIDYTHEDLKENILINTREIADNKIDDDNNGFIDDVYGWNFNGKNNNPMDDNSHGTHCAGSIGAVGDNGIGTVGVNWNVKMLPVKFLSGGGSGTTADAIESVKYATLRGVNIMSNSWGGGGFSQGLFDAIDAAKAKGILFVAAAGNDGENNDTGAHYPSNYKLDNVVSVAASDNRDALARFSNYGANSVHIAAPGVKIYSTVPPAVNGGKKYDTYSGTSMATPHVAGAAALLWGAAKNPAWKFWKKRSWNYVEIKDRLLATAEFLPAFKTKTISKGRLNVLNALENKKTVPAEPSGWKSVTKNLASPNPYPNAAKLNFEIYHKGAKFIRIHFAKFDTEDTYDKLTIRNEKGEVSEEVSGARDGYTTLYVEGEMMKLEFTSDASVNKSGFVIDKYEFID